MTEHPAAPTTTDESAAEYVRHHQCWQADPNVTIADWHRGILAIEAEARSTPAEALDVEAVIEASPRHYPNDNCGDPDHDRLLEAWYARAEGLLGRAEAARLSERRDKEGME